MYFEDHVVSTALKRISKYQHFRFSRSNPGIAHLKTLLMEQRNHSIVQTKLKKVSGPPAWSIFCQVKAHRKIDR